MFANVILLSIAIAMEKLIKLTDKNILRDILYYQTKWMSMNEML